MEKTNRNLLIYFVSITALSFILIFIGVRFLLHNPLSGQNILSFLILSLLLGLVSTALYFLKWKIACTIFLLGLIAGFFQMYRLFLQDLDGWGDLAGLISLFSSAVLGLLIGLLGEFTRYCYHKFLITKGSE